MEYSCFITFRNHEGEGKIILGDDELCCLAQLNEFAVAYTGIVSIEIINYKLLIKTEQDTLTLSQLGYQITPAYEQIYERYNKKVLKALFIDEPPLFETNGEYRYSDERGSGEGSAAVKLFERCLCILPPNEGGRRIPLCFVRTIEKENYRLKLTLDTGETYELIRMGWDTENFENKLNECMNLIRRNAINAALAVDPTLEAIQSARIALLMPEGGAAPMGELSSISPSFFAAIEEKIKNSRAAETYLYFKNICDPNKIMAGNKSYLAGADQKDILWIVAPIEKDNGGVAALEMALSEESSAATYVYRFSGAWDAFAMRLNHAIEAVNFRREVIFLSDEELECKENALYKMTVRRTSALQFLRKSHKGRVIHRTLESWKKDLNTMFELTE
jgi:predicted transposase YbfD/YdcC